MSKIIKVSRLFSVFEMNSNYPMLLLEVNSAMFWVSRSILRQLSPTFKLEEELQKEANRINRFIAL